MFFFVVPLDPKGTQESVLLIIWCLYFSGITYLTVIYTFSMLYVL